MSDERESAEPTYSALEPSPVRPSSSSSSSPITGGWASGTVLAGRYRVVALLGKGGMGEVYQAEDLHLGQLIAVKFLRDELAGTSSGRERLAAEVRLARQVTHPSVCRVHDLGEIDGRVFLTMEYVDGEDLASLVRRIGRLPGAKAREIARELGAGLQAAHDRGVVHRDLKPGNIMLDGRGQVRVTDFGLAILDGTDGAEVAGTPAYMAPEQLAGHGATVASDVFAFGLVLYELWTGRRAWPGTRIGDIRAAQAAGPPPSPRSLGADMTEAEERAILRCLSPSPAQRPRSVAAAVAAQAGAGALDAALAAGETPSPELVAAQGEDEALAPAQAVGLFAAVVALLFVVLLVGPHGTVHGLLPAPRSLEVMKERAREIMGSLGVPGATLDEADGTFVPGDVVNEVLRTPGPSPEVRARLRSMVHAPRFWYRRSTTWLEPELLGRPQAHHGPTPYHTGDATVIVDAAGRLVSFRSVPDESLPPRPVDPSPLFAAARIDPTSLKPAAPLHILYGTISDTSLAWAGTLDGRDILVESAFWKGQPVSFRVGSPHEGYARSVLPPPPLGERLASWAFVLTGIVVVVFLGLAARQNSLLGRSDPRGAARLGTVVFVLAIAMTLLVSHLLPTPTAIQFAFLVDGVWCLGVAVAVYYAYLAVEPALRRRYPLLLVSWTRFLSGDVRDPLVARHVLLGLIAGVAVFAVRCIVGALPTWVEVQGVRPMWPWAEGATSVTAFVGDVLINAVLRALGYGLLVVGALVLGRVVLRHDRLAWLVPALLLAVVPFEGRNLAVDVVQVSLVTLIYLLALRKAGLLGFIAAVFAFFVLNDLPPTASLDRWYSAASIGAAAVISVVGAVAARLSMGRRPLFSGALLEA